jgi:2-polyprenyl-3-methyl-5-hydroxy-6-metoxy-1,4-benzoquinol methylase
MSALRRVTGTEELMDQPVRDPVELEGALSHVAQVNAILGGVSGLIRAVQRHRQSDALDLLDVGTGSGVMPRALVRWARQHHLPIRVRATDMNPETLEVARRNCSDYPEITVEPANALDLPYPDRSFTHALMTLTLHHFEGTDQTTVLRQLARVSREAAIVSDLERCWPNYLGARVLAATWWRRNRLTRHDGPLSVLRAFTPAELRAAAEAAGLETLELRRAFFYRLTLVLAPAGKS